ncbi:MAG: N-acetyltransferase, partial [Comamonadaceae bacterium]
MRIDVALDHRDLDGELAALHRRMHTPGDALHGMATVPTTLPGLAVRYREVAGEFYLYVEDVAQHALAGHAVEHRAA